MLRSLAQWGRGRLVFLVREVDYENQRRELVARSRGAVIRIL